MKGEKTKRQESVSRIYMIHSPVSLLYTKRGYECHRNLVWFGTALQALPASATTTASASSGKASS